MSTRIHLFNGDEWKNSLIVYDSSEWFYSSIEL